MKQSPSWATARSATPGHLRQRPAPPGHSPGVSGAPSRAGRPTPSLPSSTGPAGLLRVKLTLEPSTLMASPASPSLPRASSSTTLVPGESPTTRPASRTRANRMQGGAITVTACPAAPYQVPYHLTTDI